MRGVACCVNTVCPGGIDTEGMRFYLKSMPAMREKTLNAHAMGRLAKPEEIADAVVYFVLGSSLFSLPVMTWSWMVGCWCVPTW